MDDFETSGFLGNGISRWTESYREFYSEWLRTYLELNSFAQDVFRLCVVPSNDIRRALAKTLFIRILSNYQGAYLLGERGMEAEAKILLRAMCEAGFALVAVVKDAEFAASYIRHNEAQRLKCINRLLSNDAGITDCDKRAEMNRQRKLLQAEQASGQIESLGVSKIAEKADMKKVYCTAYAYMSLSVHASSQDLARHLQTDGLGKITHLLWGPTHKESQEMLRAGMRLLWAFVDALGDLFQLDISTELNTFNQRIRKIEESKTQ